MKDRRNYYRVLHLQPDAPIGLVKVNHRVLMQKLAAHPDLGGENWKAAHLNAACHTLSDPERRAEYDRELLSRCDITVIAEGLRNPRQCRPATRTRLDGNRRNYYRVLQAQRDSPFEILEASHRALSAGKLEDQTLLDAALALLGDETLRSTYDRLIEVYDHQDTLVHLHADRGSEATYKPTIRSFCAFCKRPHMQVEESEPGASCVECDSPLFPPPRALADLARRTLTRLARPDHVKLFFEWPSSGVPGKVVDLSPMGMRCETTARLDPNDVVKISSDRFNAVGSVSHSKRLDSLTNAGMRFLAVRFPLSVGNFRSLKV